jgi:hypothetical protein
LETFQVKAHHFSAILMMMTNLWHEKKALPQKKASLILIASNEFKNNWN